jgi:NADPH:quinone reductase
MNAIICKTHGLPDSLSFENIDIPKPNAGQVRIKVVICSVNFPDALIIQNKYQFKPELPFSPGSEVSGIIDELGEGVENFQIGQRVLSLCGWGGMAEYLVVDTDRVFPLPASMDYEMGASLMYNYGTSYHALKDRAKLRSGETLLVLGASGGVGLAAIQLAKLIGAKVIAAASTQEKLDVCKANGADFCINYETQNLKDELKNLGFTKGIDVIYDPVGDKYAEPALRNMAWKGRYLVVGFAAGQIPQIPLNLALLKGCAIMGVFWGQFAALETKLHIDNTRQIAEWFAEGKLNVHVFKKYKLVDAAQGIQDMMDRKVIGKSLIICNEALAAEKVEAENPLKASNSKTIFETKDAIFAMVGHELGRSKPFMVSQAMINDFADATYDHQWIHLDTERAKETPFKSTIVHGFFTLSLSVHLMEQTYEIKNSLMGINYGTDKVRFLQPVRSGGKLTLVSKLVEAVEAPNNGIKMKIEAAYYVSGSEKPVCVAELLSVVYF